MDEETGASRTVALVLAALPTVPAWPTLPDMPADRSDPSPVTFGAALVFEELTSNCAPLRVRPYEDALLRVIAGHVRLTTDEGEWLLKPGDEAIVPAGSCYRVAGVSGDARTVTGYRSPRA